MKDYLEFNLKFIKLVQDRPCLYDYRRPDYSDRNLQNDAWLEIAKEVNESVADCKERWKNIRGCYTRHLKKTSKPSGSAEKYTKPYYLADKLRFLEGFTKTRRSKDTFKSEEQNVEIEYEIHNNIDNDREDSRDKVKPLPALSSSDETTHSNDEDYIIPNKVTRKSRKLSPKNVNVPSYFESRQHAKCEEDPDLSFLYSILPDMKEMTREQKRSFKMGILQLVGDILQNDS